MLYTQPAADYEPTGTNITQSTVGYHNLDQNKKKLYRSYQELICYVPWQYSPDDTFLSASVREELQETATSNNIKTHYTLRRLEVFHRVYMDSVNKGLSPSLEQPGIEITNIVTRCISPTNTKRTIRKQRRGRFKIRRKRRTNGYRVERSAKPNS